MDSDEDDTEGPRINTKVKSNNSSNKKKQQPEKPQ